MVLNEAGIANNMPVVEPIKKPKHIWVSEDRRLDQKFSEGIKVLNRASNTFNGEGKNNSLLIHDAAICHIKSHIKMERP